MVVDSDGTRENARSNDLETEDVRVERRGAAGTIVLQRPRALNAVNRAMRGALTQAYPRFARDPIVYGVVQRSAVPSVFSVGGDVREMAALAATPTDVLAAFFEVLQLCWLHECFSKPTVSLIDGPVMGSGVGISLYGTHRIAGAGYRFSMPEAAIGFFPDCGTSYAFSRMPHAIGIYLALTGRAIGPADAYALGLLTHCIPANQFTLIAAHMEEADPVDAVLDEMHESPEPSPLIADGPRIARYFDAARVTDIIDRLKQAPAADRAWADALLADLRQRSPFSLCVTLAAVRRARHLDLRETLQQDYRIASRLLVGADFREGVRAALIDKTKDPRWSPATLDEVTPAMIEAVFAPAGADEPVLPTREEMQAARV